MKLVKIDSLSPVGSFEIKSGALRVTDPCYDGTTWCAGTLDNVPNGKWFARVGYHLDEDDLDSYKRRIADLEAQLELAAERATIKDKSADAAIIAQMMLQSYERELAEFKRGYERYTGRVAFLHIWHESSHVEGHDSFATMDVAPLEVGVDSGQAGFFDLDSFLATCMTRHDRDTPEHAVYERRCRLTCDYDNGRGDEVHPRWGVDGDGVVSSSGWGDGSYSCLTRRDSSGKLLSAVIVYLQEYDEEDEEDLLADDEPEEEETE